MIKVFDMTRLMLVSSMLLLSGCDWIMEATMRVFMDPGPPVAVDGVEIIRDIEYSPTPLVLDLLRPAAHSDKLYPVVVYIHGGGFKHGSKNFISKYDDHMLPLEGFAVVSINYTLSGEAPFPAQLRDVQRALQWIRENADQYNLDADKVALIGYSAGGHLAALTGVSSDWQVLSNDVVPRQKTDSLATVVAVVDYFGSIDALAGADNVFVTGKKWSDPDSMVADFLGGPLFEKQDLAIKSNPVTYVTPDDPPVLMIHGDQDTSVPIRQSQIFYDALVAANVEAELMVIEDGKHGYDGAFNDESHRQRKIEFLVEHLQP